MTADDDDGRSRVCDVASAVGGVKDFIMSDKPVAVVRWWWANETPVLKLTRWSVLVYAIVLFQLNNQKEITVLGSRFELPDGR